MDVSFMAFLYDQDDNWVVLELRKVTYRPPDVGWFRTCPGVFKASDTPPDLGNVVRIRLELGSASKNGVQAHVDDMRLHPKPNKGYIVLSWDDGNQNYYDQAAPINDNHGFPAVITMPVKPKRAGSSYFMSIEELHERQDKGDEVVVHGSTSSPFAKISAKKLEHILRRNKQWMIDNGFEGADFIVYPGNNYDKTALKTISKYFSMGGMNQSGNVNTTGVYGFDPLVLPRTIGNRLDISKRAVTLAAKYRQCTILNFHNFNSSNTMSPSDYKKLLTHIDSTKGIEVITFSDLWDMRRSQQ
ncbi:polysaccharide deacetylase family protein [Haladaptatus sp. CMAA 1911]|uniref:polysaccharide deacetylase family protein n=1 Tax=unclassified Haladaptatus TaxID=2622732 RepID=UPI003754BF50